MNKLKLHGFNNLTKTLSLNIYDVCYVSSQKEQQQYIAYIDSQYSTAKLTNILKDVSEMIGANIINMSSQEYDPYGASVTLLVAEEPIEPNSNTVLGHLDKSHLAVHTYPEFYPDKSIATCRVDIDISTCGMISPLGSINYLIENIDSDIIIIDYKVRGFTRNNAGEKCYIDHNINSIQDFIEASMLEQYDIVDLNVLQANIFNTKMMRKEMILDDYLFNGKITTLSEKEIENILGELRKEMTEIFNGINMK